MHQAATLFRLRTLIYRSAWFPVLFLIFIAEFYFIPESKWQNNLFRIGLLLPFLLVFPLHTCKARLARSRILLATCLLIVFLLASLGWSPAAEPGTISKTLSHGLYTFGFVLIGSDILLRNPRQTDLFFYWLGWLIVITGILSIWLFYADHHFPKARLEGIGQLRHPGFAAVMYGFVALYHYMAIPYSHYMSHWQRWLPGVLAVVTGMAVIVMAQSRGVFLALLAALFVGGIISWQRRYIIAIALIALGLVLTLGWWTDDVIAMINRGGLDAHRLDIWRQAIELIGQAPFFGHGILEYSTFPLEHGQTQHHAHNILLSTLVYGGMVSCSLLILVMGLTLKQGWLFWKGTHDLKPLLLIVFGFTYLMTDGYQLISNPLPYWVYFWLPVIWAISRELQTAPAIPDRRA